MAQLTSKDLNMQIVSMRKEVRKAVVHRIHGLSQKARMLRLKKGTDEQKQKNEKKADVYVSEIQVLKKLKPDNVSLFALSNPNEADLKVLIGKPILTEETKAMAKLCLRENMRHSVDEFILRYKDSLDLLSDLISERYSNTGKEKKKRKKLRGKKKKSENETTGTINNQKKSEKNEPESNNKTQMKQKDKIKISQINKEKVVNKKDAIDKLTGSNESIPELVSISEESQFDHPSSDSDEDPIAQNDLSEENDEIDSSQDGANDEEDDDVDDDSSQVVSENDSEQETSNIKNVKVDLDSVKSGKHLQNKNKNIEKNSNKVSIKSPKRSPLERKKVDPFFKTPDDSEYLSFCDVKNKIPDDNNRTHNKFNDFKSDRTDRYSSKKGFRENRPFKREFSNKNSFDRSSNNRQPFGRKFSGNAPFKKGYSDQKFHQRNINDRNSQNQSNRSNSFRDNNRKRPSSFGSKTEPEVKLHPSWEAKKKLNQGPIAFQGKKVVFDD